MATALRTLFTFAALLAATLSTREAAAHVPKDLVGTQVKLLVFEDRIRVILDLGYRSTWAQAEMIRMDTDGNSQVSQAEADAYCKMAWETKILRLNANTGEMSPTLRCKIDGKDVPLVLEKIVHAELVGKVFPVPFTIYFHCDLTPPDGPFQPDESHRLAWIGTQVESA